MITACAARSAGLKRSRCPTCRMRPCALRRGTSAAPSATVDAERLLDQHVDAGREEIAADRACAPSARRRWRNRRRPRARDGRRRRSCRAPRRPRAPAPDRGPRPPPDARPGGPRTSRRESARGARRRRPRRAARSSPLPGSPTRVSNVDASSHEAPGAQKPLVTIRGLDAGGARRAWWGDAAGSSVPLVMVILSRLRAGASLPAETDPASSPPGAPRPFGKHSSVASRRPAARISLRRHDRLLCFSVYRDARARCGRRRRGPSRPGASSGPQPSNTDHERQGRRTRRRLPHRARHGAQIRITDDV
mgnify:CR=1 FL=1